MKENRKAVINGSLTPGNKHTPAGLFFSINSLSVQNGILHLIISLPSVPALNFPAELFLFFFFKESNNAILTQQEKIETKSPDDIYSLTITLTGQIQKALDSNPAPLVFISIAGEPVKKKIYWTGTVAKGL